MKVGIPAETRPNERRVGLTPSSVRRIVELGYEVIIESGAGESANLPDQMYVEAGAEVSDNHEAWECDIVVKVWPPEFDTETDVRQEADLLAPNSVLVSLFWPERHEALIEHLSGKNISALALDQVPRVSRAQSIDVLSSTAGIAGYRAVIEAANHFGRFFAAQMTAAGSTPPAEVLVIGAGVAGLQAIATANEMGANVKAFDTRPRVKQEVESLGGNFLELDFEEDAEGSGGYAKVMSDEFIEAEMALFRERAPETDIIITTASIPGREAPKLILEDMVASMPSGGVIVDLAADSGGNCELTVPDETVVEYGITIVGHTNLASRLPTHASEYFGQNIANLFKLFGEAEDFEIDTDDRVIRDMLVLHEGKITWPPPERDDIEAEDDDTDTEQEGADEQPVQGEQQSDRTRWLAAAGGGLALALMLLIGAYAPPDFVQHFTVFVLACFVGWQVVWNVTPSLHTPLMSVTNAISGIIIVGGLLQVTAGASGLILGLSLTAVAVASINIFGGFLVTQRMLGMFRAEED